VIIFNCVLTDRVSWYKYLNVVSFLSIRCVQLYQVFLIAWIKIIAFIDYFLFANTFVRFVLFSEMFASFLFTSYPAAHWPECHEQRELCPNFWQKHLAHFLNFYFRNFLSNNFLAGLPLFIGQNAMSSGSPAQIFIFVQNTCMKFFVKFDLDFT